jgi:hypothetical protein
MSRSVWARAAAYYKRNASHVVFKMSLQVRIDQPLISFKFDEFPRTALAGAKILEGNGVAGTFFVSLGLPSKDSPSRPICNADDLLSLWQQGHKMGCQTFSHCHSWNTSSADFEASVLQNRKALNEIMPGRDFRSFSYGIWRHVGSATGTGRGVASRACLLRQLSFFWGTALNDGCAGLRVLRMLEKASESLSRRAELVYL